MQNAPVVARGFGGASLEIRREDHERARAGDSRFARQSDGGRYVFTKSGEADRTSEQMIRLYEDWLRQYPIISIEDGLAEGDWAGWQMLTRTLGTQTQLVGDDVFVTNPEILKKG